MEKMKNGNSTIIMIVVGVAVAGIIGYMVYNNNQKQAAADTQVAASQAQAEVAQKEAADAQQDAQQAQAQQAAQTQALNTAVDTAQTEAVNAQANAAAGAQATCEESLANAQKNLPNLEDYAETLEQGAEIIEDNPDEAIEACRNSHEGLSKPECETKVDNFVTGKEDLYAEIETEIETAEATIAAGC